MAAPPTTPQKLAAEFLGTAFLVFVGAGSAAATGVIAAGTKVPFSMAQLGMISFAFMLVIVGAVYAIGHISGGHINPAVTLSLAVSGKFPWREVPGYMIAQLAGAIAGAASIYLTLGRLATVAAEQLGSAYRLAGDVRAAITTESVTSGHVTLRLQLSGVYTYRLSGQQLLKIRRGNLGDRLREDHPESVEQPRRA